MKNYAQALSILKSAYDSAPQYVQAAEAYAIALQLNGDDAQARSILPNNPIFNSTLNTVKTYAANNEFYKLFVLFNGVTFVSDDVNLVISQAQMEYTQGMIQQAIQLLLTLESVHSELKTGVDGMVKEMSAQLAVPK
jgi:tetratricopeptide (TPR) repeat protein